jgi:hypothetical protein
VTCATPAVPVVADLRGSVVDDAKRPVAGAQVTLHRNQAVKTTDAHGAFAWSKIEIGTTACGKDDLGGADVELDVSENGRVGHARAQLHSGTNELPAIAIAVPDSEIPEVPLILGVTASATSSRKGDEPWHALLGDPTKLWCEARADEGVGEAITLHFGEPTKIESVKLRPGVWRSPELFRQYNRVTELRVVPDTGDPKPAVFTEDRQAIEVAMGRYRIQQLRIELATVAKGKTNDSCISGVEIKTEPPSVVVLGEAPASSLSQAFTRAWRAFAACDEKALQAELQFPFVANRRYGDAKAVRADCKAGTLRDFRPPPAPLVVLPEAPGKVVVRLAAGKLEWHFVLASNAWRLATVVQLP